MTTTTTQLEWVKNDRERHQIVQTPDGDYSIYENGPDNGVLLRAQLKIIVVDCDTLEEAQEMAQTINDAIEALPIVYDEDVQ